MIWKNNKPKRMSEEDESQTITFQMEGTAQNNVIQDNKIYFYNEIDNDSILLLQKQIDAVSKQLKILHILYNLPTIPEIELHLSTPGGDLCTAMAMADRILNNSVPINTYCEGMVASGGTLLSIAGKKRYITKNSCLLIHQLSIQNYGTYQNLIDEKQNCDILMRIIKNAYLKHTKFKSKELDALLKRDLYLDSDDALKYGVVDYII